MFDLDGTLLDTKPAYVEAARIAFDAVGQKIPPPSLILEIPKRIEKKQPINDIVKGNVENFLEAYLKAFHYASPLKTKPFGHTADTLALLSGKAKLSLITMRYVPCTAVASELERFKIDQYFTLIVTALDTNKPKPSPEALIKAVIAMDVKKCECAIVGDSVIDVEAGRAAGIRTISVLTGLYSHEELSKAKPDYIVDSVAELPDLFL